MPFVHIEGLKLYYNTFGTGDITLLLLPGLLGTIETNFEPIIQALDKDAFTVVSWDPAGYGKSYPPGKKHFNKMYYREAGLVGKIIEKLEMERYHVFGWSAGGQTAVLLAAMFPNNVITCTTYGAGVWSDPKNVPQYKTFTEIETWPEAQLEPLLKYMDMEYLKEVGNQVYEAYVQGAEENFRYPREWLEPVKCPTLLMHGMNDNFVDISSSQYLASIIPTARIHAFPSGGHHFILSNSDEVLKVWNPFVLQNMN